jgi:hypothetical protein
MMPHLIERYPAFDGKKKKLIRYGTHQLLAYTDAVNLLGD